MKAPALSEIWNDTSYELQGVNQDCRQSIDRDQAVDDDGNALYESYIMLGDDVIYEYSAEEIEDFARTW